MDNILWSGGGGGGRVEIIKMFEESREDIVGQPGQRVEVAIMQESWMSKFAEERQKGSGQAKEGGYIGRKRRRKILRFMRRRRRRRRRRARRESEEPHTSIPAPSTWRAGGGRVRWG
eukprot:392536-Hanusia_phi.AAC.3